MNKIEKLIQELCPEGVNIRLLGDLEDSGVLKLGRGNVISKSDLASTPGDFPVYSSSAAGEGEFGRYGKFMFEDERITWSVDGGGRFFYRPPHKYSVTNVSGWLKVLDPKALSTKYLAHVLFHLWSTKTYNYIVKAHPSVIRQDYSIPVPPIQVQQEIVSILDKFTALEAELGAELEARSTQYETYREEILFSQTSNLSSAETPIGELVSKISSIKWADDETTLKYVDLSSVNIDLSEILSFTPVNKASAPSRAQQVIKDLDVLFGTTRPTLRRIAFVTSEFDGALASTGFCVLRPNLQLIHPRYLFHIVSSKKFLNYVEQHQQGASYPSISNSKVLEFNFPLPTLGIQKKRLEILDAFNILVKGSANSLPAEIQARRKQYEYYRNKLLTFKELDAA